MKKIKFLVQKIDGKIRHDFSRVLIEAVDYAKFFGNNDYSIKFAHNLEIDPVKHVGFIPVGSVEFVLLYFKIFYPNIPLKPINVPEQLNKEVYTYRKIENVENPIFVNGVKKFVKSNDKIKEDPIIVNGNGEALVGNFQVSQVVDILSEYRCFVFNKKLVGINRYFGDFRLFPAINAIESMISEYTNAPIAYTLDVGISRQKMNTGFKDLYIILTFVVEVHDFFSCGLYGFEDYKLLPTMMSQWFFEKTRNYNR